MTCVVWQLTLCDPIWQETPYSCEMGSINSYAGPLIFNSKADRLWLMDLELSGVHDIARPRRVTAHTR